MLVPSHGGDAAKSYSATPLPREGLRAARAVCRDRGISDVTLWRMTKRGDIRTVNVYGRLYVDLASLAEFDRRALAGEFARQPVGAAAEAAKARASRLLTPVIGADGKEAA